MQLRRSKLRRDAWGRWAGGRRVRTSTRRCSLRRSIATMHDPATTPDRSSLHRVRGKACSGSGCGFEVALPFPIERGFLQLPHAESAALSAPGYPPTCDVP